MDNSYFFSKVNEDLDSHPTFLLIRDALQLFSEYNKSQVYIISNPVSERKYKYEYKLGFVILIPKKPLFVINIGASEEMFDDYEDDFVEDLGIISDKYNYRDVLGRPKRWKETLIKRVDHVNEVEDLLTIIRDTNLETKRDEKSVRLLISLLTGSINDIDRVTSEIPGTQLDQIKKNIILFDGEQTRFVFEEKNKDIVTIQGLAGTGKTELLLHKIKDIYVNEPESKLFLTCFSKILSLELKDRIPSFFDFMKVEEQIKWDERLWVGRSWGSEINYNVGLYSFICYKYGIPFERYTYGRSFNQVCKNAYDLIREQENIEPILDYIFVDESQDFGQEFFDLCKLVTAKQVYIAGDIFQNIFDYNILTENKPDYLLNRVYRTDPKTLIFAHVLGFGLKERPVIRWLNDEEWKACGYNIEKSSDEFYSLSRDPLNRFDDIGGELQKSIQLVDAEKKDYLQATSDILDKIIANNPTIQPGDIGIVFLENTNDNYNLAEQISLLVDQKYSWPSVKGYDSKKKDKDSLFISNRNNIKGLEFPFVICIVKEPLTSNITIRNSLYMMLTRSFISTYLIVNKEDHKLNSELQQAINQINNTGKITVKKPKNNEIMDRSQLQLEEGSSISQYQIVEGILNELYISDPLDRKKMHTVVNTLLKDCMDKSEIMSLITNNLSHL